MPPPRNLTDSAPLAGETAIRVCPNWLRYTLLVALLIHLLGLVAEPLRFFSRSVVRTAPEFEMLRGTLRPYSQWLYMDHGYFFFAPNPGPTHLIRCVAVQADKPELEAETPQANPSPTHDFVIPDKKTQWPRLLYHRFFMLSEFYNSRFAPRELNAEEKKDRELVARWTFDRDLYVQIQTSIVKSISHSIDVPTLELIRLERALPDSFQVLKDNWALDDPRLLEVLPESVVDESVPPKESELPALPHGPNRGTQP